MPRRNFVKLAREMNSQRLLKTSIIVRGDSREDCHVLNMAPPEDKIRLAARALAPAINHMPVKASFSISRLQLREERSLALLPSETRIAIKKTHRNPAPEYLRSIEQHGARGSGRP